MVPLTTLSQRVSTGTPRSFSAFSHTFDARSSGTIKTGLSRLSTNGDSDKVAILRMGRGSATRVFVLQRNAILAKHTEVALNHNEAPKKIKKKVRSML